MTGRSPHVEPPLALRSVHVLSATATILALGVFLVSWPEQPLVVQQQSDLGSSADHSRFQIQIDLNTASRNELSLVPGVGPVLANRIIENRQRLGRFPTMESLARVHGVGPRTIQRIASICVINSPRPTGSGGSPDQGQDRFLGDRVMSPR